MHCDIYAIGLLCTEARRNVFEFKGNCHELRMHFIKFTFGNVPGFLAIFRLRNLPFCLELPLWPQKARQMRAVLLCIDAALNQT